MRLSYVPNPPAVQNAEEEAILSRVLERRGSQGLIALDRTLLHAPLITDGWNAFMVAIRTRNSLPADLRETAFCRVAALMGAWYEWDIHAPLARDAGVTNKGMETLKKGLELQAGGQALTEKQKAVVAYVDAMTIGTHVPNGVFEEVKSFFSDKEVVELTASVAGFNAVSRFVIALDVGEKNQVPVE